MVLLWVLFTISSYVMVFSAHFVCAEVDVFLMFSDGIFQRFCGSAPTVINIGNQQIGLVYHIFVAFEYAILRWCVFDGWRFYLIIAF